MALLVAALGLVPLALLGSPAGASAPVGPDPATTNPVTLTFHTPTTGLVNGSLVTYTVATTSPTKLISTLKTHICNTGVPLTGAGSFSAGAFGYSGATTKCVYDDGSGVGSPPGLTSGGLTGSDYETSYTYSGSETTSDNPPSPPNPSGVTNLGFHVGTGSVTWGNTTGHAGALTCDSTHPCDLVLEVNLTGDSSATTTYFKQTLTFAGKPDAPTLVSATDGEDQSTDVVLTAPANTGNGTINHYYVRAHPTAGGSDIICDGGTSTHFRCNALTNFTQYRITAYDTIAELSGAAGTSNDSSTFIDVTPMPPAPTNVSASAADGEATVTWTAPGSIAPNSPQPVTEYEVTAHDTTNTLADQIKCTGSNATNFLFTGLQDGTPYSFAVRASYGGAVGSPACVDGGTGSGPFGPFSGASSSVTPSGYEIDQLIQVIRPTGDLVLTQACDPNTPDPYPQDPATGLTPDHSTLYPTSSIVAGTPGALGSCSVDLGAAKLVASTDDQPIDLGTGYPTNVAEGQFFKADGAIHQVTVVNARETNEPWTVNGKLTSSFTDGSDTLSATALGWEPALTDKTPDFTVPDLGTYHNDAAAGDPVLPASHAADQGLSISRTLAQAAVHGLGEAHLDALLHMLIPIQTPHGTYTAMLQITAI
jgi:hypothetical protein